MTGDLADLRLVYKDLYDVQGYRTGWPCWIAAGPAAGSRTGWRSAGHVPGWCTWNGYAAAGSGVFPGRGSGSWLNVVLPYPPAGCPATSGNQNRIPPSQSGSAENGHPSGPTSG